MKRDGIDLRRKKEGKGQTLYGAHIEQTSRTTRCKAHVPNAHRKARDPSYLKKTARVRQLVVVFETCRWPHNERTMGINGYHYCVEVGSSHEVWNKRWHQSLGAK